MPDKRIIKTKEALYHALGSLLQEKNFYSISVSELVKVAHTTRKTFYNHYQDKIDLVQDYQFYLSTEIQKLQTKHHAFDQNFFTDLFNFLDKQDKLLTSLMSFNGSSELQSIMKGTIEQYCKINLKDYSIDSTVLEYQAILMSNTIFGVIQHWLITGKKNSPSEIAKIVCSLKFPI